MLGIELCKRLHLIVQDMKNQVLSTVNEINKVQSMVCFPSKTSLYGVAYPMLIASYSISNEKQACDNLGV